jgi:hypothetical protein
MQVNFSLFIFISEFLFLESYFAPWILTLILDSQFHFLYEPISLMENAFLSPNSFFFVHFVHHDSLHVNTQGFYSKCLYLLCLRAHLKIILFLFNS